MKVLKVPRIGPARRSSNVAPTYTVNDSIARDVFVDVYIVLVQNRGVVPVAWAIRPRVW